MRTGRSRIDHKSCKTPHTAGTFQKKKKYIHISPSLAVASLAVKEVVVNGLDIKQISKGASKVRKGLLFAKRSPFREKD